ncbi:hypothetical protein J3R83DRAFT_9763 [Lanmaoa asiatica]|nr:hypothetical protein J3R83DRAFT_9763 [Lanmaoa asiatica]
MVGDPRVSKPRLPKAYTEEQLVFLRSHISGFETRTRGHVRGDAKKFALDRASEFLVRFGLPPDLQEVDEAEPRFREQIYNWYKNTVGRARRKLEGRTRPKKLSDKGTSYSAGLPACSLSTAASTSGSITWNPTLATSFTSPSDTPDSAPGPSSHSHPHPHPHPHPHSHTTQQPQQQQQPQLGPSSQQLQFTFQTALPVPVQAPSPTTISLNVTPSALRDAFATHAIDPPTLSSLIQSFVVAHPSATPLTPVVHALFDAATSLLTSFAPASTSASASGSGSASASTSNAPAHARTDVLFTLLRRFIDACAFFPDTLVHADVSGPLAGPRALQSALRRSSVWAVSTSAGSGTSVNVGVSGTNAAHGSLSDEMERIKADRQRRKDHVQWAQIHATAIELGIVGGANGGAAVGVGVTVGANASTAYHHRPAQELGYGVPTPPPSTSSVTNTFSEMMARDAVWEADEVEWVAGIIVLRAIIRTGGIGRKVEWEQLLGAYERRWKEIKDEARQALVTEVLLGARDDLARLDETRVT